jgi:hypothetical protein
MLVSPVLFAFISWEQVFSRLDHGGIGLGSNFWLDERDFEWNKIKWGLEKF